MTRSRWLATPSAGGRFASPAPRRGRRSGPAACVDADWRAAAPRRPHTCGPIIPPPSGRGQGARQQRRSAPQDRRHRGRARPQSGSRVPARRRPRDGAVRRARHRGRRASHRIRSESRRFRHLDPGSSAPRPGPDRHQRAAPGGCAAGAAVSATHTRTTCSRSRLRTANPRCWWRWTTSPIPATSARSCARWRRSAATAC